jgi:hypothetical protein
MCELALIILARSSKLTISFQAGDVVMGNPENGKL